MTDFTTAQLATILSALAGSERKPATKAAAMRAIARQAAAIDLTSEEVLAAAPGLLDGRLDPATWREQLTTPVEPADYSSASWRGGRLDGRHRFVPAPSRHCWVLARAVRRSTLIAATGWLHTTRAASPACAATNPGKTTQDSKTAYRISRQLGSAYDEGVGRRPGPCRR
jgi:hypothetical protein